MIIDKEESLIIENEKEKLIDDRALGLPIDFRNEYLSIVTGDNCRFNSGATGQVTGLPYRIIFGWPYASSTSRTSVWVDGTAIYFGDIVNGQIIQPPTNSITPDGKAVNTCIWKYGDIYVTQTLEIVFNPYDNREDVGAYVYSAYNSGTTPHDVGIRVMIDLNLNGHDGFPVSVTGEVGLITKETEFINTADSFKNFSWSAINSFATPKIGCVGDVLNENYFGVPSYDTPLPDKFVFCRWGTISGQVWNVTIDPTRSIVSDSAMAYWWNPRTLAPSEGFNAVSHYGLLEISTVGDLGLSAPVRLEVLGDGWTPNPFTANAVIYNSGEEELTDVDVRVTLEYPGLRFYGETTPTYIKTFTIPSILPGGYETVSFLVEAVEAGNWGITAVALEQSITRYVEVPRIPVQVVLLKGTIKDPVYVGEEIDYTILVENVSNSTAYNLTVIDNLPANAEFVSASVSQGTFARFGDTLEWALGDLPAGEIATATIKVKALKIGTVTNTATVYGDNVIPNPEVNTSTVTNKIVGSLGTGPVVKDKCAKSLVISISNTTDSPVTIEIVLRQTPCCIESERTQIVTIPANCIKNYIWGCVPAVFELTFNNVEEGIYIWATTREEDSRAPGNCSHFIAANRFVHSELINL